MDLGFPHNRCVLVHQSECLLQHRQPLVVPFSLPIRLGQQGQKICSVHLCPRRPVGSQALAYLNYPWNALSLLGQRPPPVHRSCRQKKREPLLPCEGYGCLCPRLGRLPLPPELMDPGGKGEGIRQAERMREILGQGQCLLAPPEGLVRIPKQPERSSHIGEEKHTKVNLKAQGQRAVLWGIVEGEALLQVLFGDGEPTEM